MTDIEKELKERIEKLEDMYHQQSESLIKNKYELKELIASAVVEANKILREKIEKVETDNDKRIKYLEDKDGRTWRTITKTIITACITTSVAWFLSSIVSNVALIITK